MKTRTVQLHRVLRAPPERAYRAFLDADALAKWVAPHGFTGRVHELDARIRHTDGFDDPNLPGVMETTISLGEAFCSTELQVVQQGIPPAIPVEACYLGWQESLHLLAQPVVADLPAA